MHQTGAIVLKECIVFVRSQVPCNAQRHRRSLRGRLQVMGRSVRRQCLYPLLLAMFFTAPAGPLEAQATTGCTYDRCALKLKRGFLSHQLVAGTQEERVANIYFLAPYVERFAERSDSAAYYYERFRSRHNSSIWFGLAGLAAFTAALIVNDSNEPVAGTLLVLGVGGLTVGLVRGIPARNDLSRGIWWYNRDLR